MRHLPRGLAVEERGDAGVERVKELTDGLGAHSVIEAVGTRESMMQAIRRCCSASDPLET